ncbi:EGF domain-specific O-linked N-acetylglucosamine transferase, partial [Bienertia sinuspersici]
LNINTNPGKDLAQLEATKISCLYEFHFEQCIINKQVIIPANQPLVVYVPSDQPSEKPRTVQPYARREDPIAMKEVTPIQILHGNNITHRKNASSYCEVYHEVPAIVFSSGGFIGNLFHELNEMIIPLFITSLHFKSQVQFVITDYEDWWVYKYKEVLKQLSSFEVLNGDSDGRVHCFPSAVFGLRYHDNLALNSSEIPNGYTMADFRNFIGKSYNLTMNGPIKPKNKPKILFISRKGTRVILNEDEMVKMMISLGFEIQMPMTREMLHLDQFAGIVNSCDIIVGAHGAGLTNEVFLRNGAIVIQIVPLALDWASEVYYGKPAHDMGLKYVEYKIGPKESSLYDVYGPDDPIISDPLTVFEQGYRKSRALYIEGQNVTIDIPRFRGVLIEALKFLGY